MNMMDFANQAWPAFAGMLESHHLLQQHEQRQQEPQQRQPRAQEPPRKKKLRESCNNCALSKVKCSKDQPSCARCEDRGIYCHYSPSQRTGKRRASSSLTSSVKTASSKVTLEPITPQSVTPPDKLQELHLRSLYDYQSLENVSTNGNTNSRNSPSDTGATSSTLNTLGANRACTELQMNKMLNEALLPWDDTMFGVNLESGGGPFDFSMSSTTPSMTPSGRSGYFSPKTGSHTDITMLDLSSTNTGIQTPLLGPSSFEAVNSLLGICSHGNTCAPPTPTRTPCSLHQRCIAESSLMAFPEDKSPTQTGQPQDCMTLTLNILQSLHMRPSTCAFASASMSGSILDFSVPPTVDHVLSTNKAIIDSITNILTCPCSLDAQLGLLLTVIGCKIIAWYRAIGRNEDEQEAATSNPTPKSNSSASSTNAEAVSTSERVSHLPITVGKYHLDGIDKTKMRAQLVLSELHRAARLVELLSKRFGEMAPCAREGAGSGSSLARVPEEEALGDGDGVLSSMCGAMEGFLKYKVRSVTKETMAVLRER